MSSIKQESRLLAIKTSLGPDVLAVRTANIQEQISRLFEQEGIYYFFQHEDGKHTLVLADSISAHKPFNGYSEVIFHELEKGATGREVITDWTVEKELQPVACALNDFDFKKPKTSLL